MLKLISYGISGDFSFEKIMIKTKDLYYDETYWDSSDKDIIIPLEIFLLEIYLKELKWTK